MKKRLRQQPRSIINKHSESIIILQQTQQHAPNAIDNIEGQSPINGEHFFQNIFFTWIYSFLAKCQTDEISVESTPFLPQHLKSQFYLSDFIQNAKNIKLLGLLSMLLRKFGKQIGIIIFLCVLVEALYLSYPILIYFNIDYIQNHKDNLQYGLGLFFATMATSFLYNLTYTNLKYRGKNLGVNISNYVNLSIFYKSLKYSLVANKEFKQADIRGLSDIDVDNLMVGPKIYYFVFGILEIFGGLGLLYWFVGLAFIAAIVVIIIISLITYIITSYGMRFTEKAFESRDERLSTAGQMLKIIRFIKLNAMQKFFYKKIQQKRQSELKNFKIKGIVECILVFLYYLTAPLLLISTLMTYYMINGTIDPSKVYTTMMIAVVFQVTSQQLPKATSQLLSVLRSIQRIDSFLQAPEIQQINYHHDVDKQNGEYAIIITKGNFFIKKGEDKQQNKNGQQNPENINQSISQELNNENQRQQIANKENHQDHITILKNINLKIQKGKFYMIFGDIGSGKSTLLLSILNQLNKSSESHIQINGKIAYISQKPWIFSGSVQNNIAFTFERDEELLNEAIKYSCLQDDLKQMAKGKNTEIGQNGINLSGGQKFRVDLARSLYSQSDIYLYDDILSAVDINVGTFIIDQTISRYLKGKTVLMATHAIKFAQKADYIILLKDGQIAACNTYEQIKKMPQFQQIQTKINQNQNKDVIKKEEVMGFQSSDENENFDGNYEQLEKQKNGQLIQSLMLPEDQQKGQVDFKYFKEYIGFNGGYSCFLLPIILCFLSYSAVQTTSSIILMEWSQNYQQKSKFYIFIGLALSANIFIFIPATILLLSGVKQGRQVHNKITKGLLYASLTQFFNRVPIGRLLNRLGKDLKQLDEVISSTLSSALLAFSRILSGIVICIYTSTPFALIPLAFVIFIFSLVRRFYLNGQTKIIRFQKITNSPLISSFTNGIIGATSIRGYQNQEHYIKSHIGFINNYKRALFSRYAIDSWFVLVLDYLGYIVNAFCIAYCMFSSNTNPAFIGLLLSYILNLNDQLFQFILDEAQFQAKLISLERLYSFMTLSPEKGYLQYCQNWNEEEQPLQRTIKNGSVQFYDVSVRYRADLPKVLKSVNFKIQAGEKIGVVGRTGSGKTTILNTLIRVNELCKGSVLIENKDINQISLKNLRKEVTVIDQQPIIINGTFRQNLDVFNDYSDQQITKTVHQCGISEMVKNRGGLQGIISNDSLSAGQKQLICICRALLKNSSIVLIDEATANIDVKHDQQIQEVISEKFIGKTLITIAHRLSTLHNSDKILVMEGGKLAEFGTPKELEERKGIYYRMITKYEKS